MFLGLVAAGGREKFAQPSLPDLSDLCLLQVLPVVRFRAVALAA